MITTEATADEPRIDGRFIPATPPQRVQRAVRGAAQVRSAGARRAQLAELAIFGRIGVVEGRVHPLDAAPLDGTRPAAEYVMECVRGQPRHHTVRTWTENLGEPLHQMIVAELVEDGVVRRVSGGFGWRRTERLPALDVLRPQRRGLAWSA